MHKFPYDWSLKDYPTSNGYKVFSCFACGGGSTMGYKLSGFEVLGCNEIDNKMATIYRQNHHPKYAFVEDIRTFKLKDDLPQELYNLDILDGSPPCTTFSIAGQREDSWGVKKKFSEGQTEQTLDDLFYEFIALTKKLQPKIFIAENVAGLLIGDAMKYTQKIITGFEDAGYCTEYWLLNSQNMGVPQSRERVFFIGLRNDLTDKIAAQKYNLFSKMPYLNLIFEETPITFSVIRESDAPERKLSPMLSKYWALTQPGDSMSSVHPTGSYFNEVKTHPNKVLPTIRASGLPYDYEVEREITTKEVLLASTFPQDYDFIKQKPEYVCGMCVPPVMIAQIASRIKEQWLDKIAPQIQDSQNKLI